MAAYEDQRRNSARKQDRQLQKLLKVCASDLQSHSPDQNISAAKRRAACDVKRQEDLKRQREMLLQAQAIIRHRLQDVQAPADFARRVTDNVLFQAGWNGMGGIASEVTPDMVDKCYEEAKPEFYKPTIQSFLKHKGIPSELGSKLEEVILESPQPWTWLSALRSSLLDHLLRQSASFPELVENISGSSQLSCQICTDPMLSASDDGTHIQCNFWSAAPRRNEHWNNYACGHTFCRSCMQTWAETAINEHRLHIKCPAAGCKYHLWDQDLQELLTSQMFDRHQEHKHADHLKNLKSVAKHDDGLMEWLRKNARPCPHCHVIVSRSEGCNTMLCVCGTRFCYACGFEKCLCSVKDKADIWNLKA